MIVFFDEFENIAASRDNKNENRSYNSSILNTLLIELNPIKKNIQKIYL